MLWWWTVALPASQTACHSELGTPERSWTCSVTCVHSAPPCRQVYSLQLLPWQRGRETKLASCSFWSPCHFAYPECCHWLQCMRNSMKVLVMSEIWTPCVICIKYTQGNMCGFDITYVCLLIRSSSINHIHDSCCQRYTHVSLGTPKPSTRWVYEVFPIMILDDIFVSLRFSDNNIKHKIYLWHLDETLLFFHQYKFYRCVLHDLLGQSLWGRPPIISPAGI